jgi:hypothetical protein
MAQPAGRPRLRRSGEARIRSHPTPPQGRRDLDQDPQSGFGIQIDYSEGIHRSPKMASSAGKLFPPEHAKEISSRVRGDPLQAGGTLRREDALVYRAGFLNKTSPVEIPLRDKLNDFAHLLTKVGNSEKYSANDSVSNSWFRSSALEDLRPSQVVFSGRLGPCEKPASVGGRRRKI